MDICVGNPPQDVTARDLREIFEFSGRVETAHLVRPRLGEESKGLGFVGMPAREEAVSAVLGVHGKTVKGQAIPANYDITGVDQNLVGFAVVIEQSVQAVSRAIGGLRHSKNARVVVDACVEVNRLENVGDMMRDRVLTELFATAKDPIIAIKWKDIDQDAETVLDVCEDVVHVMASIMVRQA